MVGRLTWRGWVAGLAAVAGAALVFWFLNPSGAARISIAAPPTKSEIEIANSRPKSKAAPIKVDVIKPRQGGIARSTEMPGTMESFDFADLYAKVSGYVKEQGVDIGDRVKRGQVLAVIDMPELDEELHRAESAEAQAEAQVDQTEARVNTAKAEFDAATAAITQAEADLEKETANLAFREKQYQRIKHLYELNSIDERLVDEKDEQRHAAQAATSSARAAIVTTKSQASAAEARIAQAQADVVDAKAKVKVAKALVAKAKVFVEYAKIVSPYEGVVTKRNFHVGDFIRAADQGGNVPLLTVARTDKMRVIVQVPERDVPYANVGDKAIVKLASLTLAGTVSRIANSEDRLTRTMRTEIDIKNPENRLRDGMFVGVTIFIEEGALGVTVPSSSVVEADSKGKSHAVFVVRGGKARLVPVDVGQDDGTRTEILRGLSVDDLVVQRPNSDLTDGASVTANEHREALAENAGR